MNLCIINLNIKSNFVAVPPVERTTMRMLVNGRWGGFRVNEKINDHRELVDVYLRSGRFQ